MPIRSPIISLLAHVDHGKTTIADAIRGSRVAAKEAGGITQMIGASYIPKETIDTLTKALPEAMRAKLKIPGLLLIDTPGHEAFTTLRTRGGSIADLAILVIDIMQGVQPQTIESIKILKQYKTPFVVAVNKVDLIDGWKSQGTTSFLESFSKQRDSTREKLDEKLYLLMGKLSEYGFDSERFDRVTDFSKQLALLPISGKTKEGLSELLMMIAGLSQKFLENSLNIEETGAAKGNIMEVKEEKGLGTTIDVIVYDGVLRKNDEIIFLTSDGIKTTHVRGLLEPNLSGKDKFNYLDEVVAASGVKIFAPDLAGVLPGSPIKVVENLEKDKIELEQQFKEVVFEHDQLGVVVKGDSLGSVEAILALLKDAEVPVKQASVGKINRKDILSAQAVSTESKYLGAVLGFNVEILEDARKESDETKIPIVWSNIIYQMLDRYKEWVSDEKEKEKQNTIDTLPWPGKIKLLPGFCFRVSKPAIFGVEVLGGKIKKGCRLMNASNTIVGEVREIQHEKKSVEEATKGMQLAISCDGMYYGKDVHEKDELYVAMNNEEIKKWEAQLALLNDDEKQVFEEIKKMLKKYW